MRLDQNVQFYQLANEKLEINLWLSLELFHTEKNIFHDDF